MWQMQDGNRVLTDPEWNLFAAGLDFLRDEIETDIPYGNDDVQVGVKAFDTLTPEQKIALLAYVAEALREAEVPPPYLTAANEGAIAAVFGCIRTLTELEIDVSGEEGVQDGTQLRRLILDAVGCGPDREEEPPPSDCRQKDEWCYLLDEIEQRILWDWDFAMGDSFLDLPPAEARAKMDQLTIDSDYYLDIPRDPNPVELLDARRTLARLLGLSAPG